MNNNIVKIITNAYVVADPFCILVNLLEEYCKRDETPVGPKNSIFPLSISWNVFL